MRQLFSVGKVGTVVDAVCLGLEKRRGGEEVTVVKLTLRIDPFDAKLAAAIDEGLGGDSNVRASAFTLSTGDPKPHLERLNMSLDCPRQRMDLCSTPDTDAQVCFDQVKVSGFYVRAQKDAASLTAVLTASFGPASAAELATAMHYFRKQVFITWLEAEPSMAFDEPDEDADDDAGDVQ